MANGYILSERFDDAISELQNISAKYSNTIHERNAMIQLANIYHFNKNDKSASLQLLNSLKSKHKEDEEMKWINWIIKGNEDGNNKRGDSTDSKTAILSEEISLNNYPNPFNPVTNICFELPASGLTTLKVYNILGSEINTLVNEYREKGNYRIPFNASNLSSGSYIYILKIKPDNGSNDITIRKTMTVVK